MAIAETITRLDAKDASQDREEKCLTQENPFNSQLARTHSRYAALHEDHLVHLLDPDQPISAPEEFVHDSLRGLVLNPRFACVAARSAFNRGTYRLGVYTALDTPEATAGLARDLWTFVQEQNRLEGPFTTFAATFVEPTGMTEETFERLLWAQLQRLHDEDRLHHPYDPSVSTDPDSGEFGFSFAGRAFFVIGLHPASSRLTRRFAFPTIVFNAHRQFEQLRAEGRYGQLQGAIRTRDRVLQGNPNPMLSDWGERSEARQYAGRAVDDEWRCPFRAFAELGEKP